MQPAWLLLLYCAQVRANFLFRTVRPETGGSLDPNTTEAFGGVWPRFWESTLSSARLGCGGATTLPQWFGAQRNSHKALYFVGELGKLHLHGGCPSPRGCCTIGASIGGASSHPLPWGSGCRSQGFNGDHELEPPSWRLVLMGTGPNTFEPGTLRQGWQHEDSSRVEENFKAALLDLLPDNAKASMRSLGGPGQGRLGTLSSKLQKKTHPKTLSSKNTFIQKHFHPKTLSSKTISSKREDNFIPRHFHPKTGSSNDTFIQKRFRPMTLSSKNGFVQ